MKLIIQIPCFNEADSLPITLAELPREVTGFDEVEWLVVDDGSTDETAAVAERMGVDHVIRLAKNKGLAAAFQSGINASLRLGADVILNTDADNQYRAKTIPAMVNPILDGKADIVVGARPIDGNENFSPVKKFLNKLGSRVVRLVSKTEIPDAPSGFRAFSREAAMRINVFSKYTYTLETIIQAGQKNMAIVSVPVEVNKDLRPSRLIRNTPSYLWNSIVTIVRIFIVYQPFRFFVAVGLTLFILGFLIGVRFLYFYLSGEGDGHVQSLILASILLGMGFQTFLVAFLADLLAVNRKLMEDIKFYLKNSKRE